MGHLPGRQPAEGDTGTLGSALEVCKLALGGNVVLGHEMHQCNGPAERELRCELPEQVAQHFADALEILQFSPTVVQRGAITANSLFSAHDTRQEVVWVDLDIDDGSME